MFTAYCLLSQNVMCSTYYLACKFVLSPTNVFWPYAEFI